MTVVNKTRNGWEIVYEFTSESWRIQPVNSHAWANVSVKLKSLKYRPVFRWWKPSTWNREWREVKS